MRKASYIVQYTLIAALSVFLIISGGCAKKSEKEYKVVTIGYQSWIGYGPFFLAKDKGFDREQGIDILIVDEPLDSARREAFNRGILDCEMGTIDLLVSKRAQGVKVVGVCALDESNGADGIVASGDIKSIEELPGRNVAYAVGDSGDTFLSCALVGKGLSIKDVKTVPAGPDDAYKYFIQGQADAVATWEPFLSKAKAKPGAHLLVSSKELSGIIIDTLNVREDLLKNDPALVKKVMRAWFKAVKYYADHPDESSGIIARHYQMTAEEYRSEVAGLEWDSYQRQLEEVKSGEWAEAFDKIARIKMGSGVVPAQPDSKSAFNTELISSLYEDKD